MQKEAKILISIGAGILVILFGVFLWYQQNTALNDSQPIDDKKLIRSDSQIIGKKDAPNTLVEFGDFQCPACGAAHPYLKELINGEYKDKLRLVFRNFPLSQHKNAYPSAQAAEAAGKQGKYTEMHDKIYESQSEWSNISDPKEMFIGYAKQLGLDEKKFESDYSDSYLKERIKLDVDDGNELGVNSTPTFYLNGEKLEIKDFRKFKEEIGAKLK